MTASSMHWAGTWATAPVPVEGRSLSNQTVRMIARVSIGGSRLRVRLSNAYGAQPLIIGSAHVALRGAGSEIEPGSDRGLTFNGAAGVAIPPGSVALSDPVDLDLAPLGDVAISVYLPKTVAEGQVTGHGNAHQTNYISTPGDFTSESSMPIGDLTTAFLVVTGLEVLTSGDTGGIVAIGDSLTDCNVSKLDANNRWPDQLARRLVARGGRQLGVMNQGIGGNRILHDGRGECGLRRFDRDVLAQSGVTHFTVLLGINDIRNREQKPEEFVSADEMIAGLSQLAERSHAHGIRIFGGTLLTFDHETFNPGFWTPEGEATRQAVNAWIRTGGAFDAVIDFEAALRDPDHPERMLPVYDCGDHLHPSDEGYLRMAECIDLSLFD